MKAVVFAGGGEVRIEDVAAPRLEEPGDALVQVSISAICGSDLHLLDGKTPGMRVGGVIGHEFVGKVMDRSGADGPAAGTRVLGSFLIACGECRYCLAGSFNHCRERRALGLGTLTGDLDGAQAEFVRVPRAGVNLLALDDEFASLEDEQALFSGDVLATGFYSAALAGLSPDATAVIVGAGPVGLFCAAALKAQGVRAIVLDLDPRRTAFARERFGLEALDASAGEPEALVSETTSGRMADAVIEAVGAPAAFKTCLRCVADGGRVVVIGVYGKERYELPMGVAWIRGLDIRFSGMANIQAHWLESLRATVAGRVDPVAAVTHRLPLDDAVEGYRLFAAREAEKVLLTP